MTQKTHEPLDSVATINQSIAIANSLNENGITAELVENELGEPLAVMARGSLDISRMVGSIGIHEMKKVAHVRHEDYSRLMSAFPICGSTMYPSGFLDLMDISVRAVTGRDDVSATRISRRSVEDDRWRLAKTPGRGIGLHIDFPGNADRHNAEDDLAGLNFHATFEGEAKVTMGILRSLASHEHLFGSDQADKRELLQRLGAPFVHFTLGPGDVLIFQAQQRTARGILPIVHDFVTTTDEGRLSDAFVPDVGFTADILAQRSELTELYSLHQAGYPASRPQEK